MSELYATLTLRMGLQPDYVLDRMEFYEVRALMEYEYLSYKDSWEQARLISFITAQCNSSKTLNMKELVPLYWDSCDDASTRVENVDVERLKKKAEEYLKNINN